MSKTISAGRLCLLIKRAGQRKALQDIQCLAIDIAQYISESRIHELSNKKVGVVDVAKLPDQGPLKGLTDRVEIESKKTKSQKFELEGHFFLVP